MNGLEIVRALHHEGVFVSTILISGRVDADLILRARQLDVTAVLAKPIAVARLVELVRTALGSHG